MCVDISGPDSRSSSQLVCPVIEVGYYTGQSVCPSQLFIGEVQSIEVDSGSNKVN